MYNTQKKTDDEELKCRSKHQCMKICSTENRCAECIPSCLVLFYIMRKIYEDKVMMESWYIIRNSVIS